VTYGEYMTSRIPYLVLVLLAGCMLVPGAVHTQMGPGLTTQTKSLDNMLVESWGRQKTFFIEGNFEIIPWEEAQILLQKGNLRGGKQYHTGWLTIYSLDGRKYLTKPPVLDAFFQFMKQEGLSADGFAPE
jgi:hypothetical protein